MLENDEMSVGQVTSASHAVLDDAILELIAAGFDEVEAKNYAQEFIENGEERFWPKSGRRGGTEITSR